MVIQKGLRYYSILAILTSLIEKVGCVNNDRSYKLISITLFC